MDLSKITKIETLQSPDAVNEYLALGWVLTAIYTTAYDTSYPGCNHQTPHYVLGWLDGEPRYPEPETDFGFSL